MFFIFIVIDGLRRETKGANEAPWAPKVAQKDSCRNPSLRFGTKVRACKGAGQEGNMGITSHAPRSVGECESMNPHTPKWAPILEIRVPMDS